MVSLLQHTSSPDLKLRQRVGDLKRFIQHYLIYRSGLQYLVIQGVISPSTSETVFHDYLNETTGLFDYEYFALESIYHEHWEDDLLNEKDSCNECDYDYASIANIRDVSSLIGDVRDLINYLCSVNEEIHNLEEKGVMNGDDASDLFSTILSNFDLCYSSYLDLSDLEWVEEDEE